MANAKFAVFVVLVQFSGFISAQNATSTSSKWQTLYGSLPLVIARGGFSGLFPDSCSYAYIMAMMTSVPDLVLWCDVQLTKDGVGICLPSVILDNGTQIDMAHPGRANSYVVDGVRKSGYFSIDFTLKELGSVYLAQGLISRPFSFDANMLQIQTVEDVFTQNKPAGFWLNIQHASFYRQHKLNMRNYVIRAANNVIISHISSPEIPFLQELSKPFASTKTKLVFRFLEQDAIEPSTKKTYGALLKNLTFIKSFASGILVPKTYVWPVDATSYVLPHSSVVADAHKIGLEVFASDFANDNRLPYNYSYNPVNEYLHFIDNNEFSVDGVLTDFPLTSSEARDCFAHTRGDASAVATPVVISHFGASGDYPGCTDTAYTTAISDGADVIDCPVQFSKDGVPFCLSYINLLNITTITQSQFRNLLTTVPEIQSNPGIFSFSLTSTEIQSLSPVIESPSEDFALVRNPKHKNDGKIITLSDFLDLAKNASTLSGVSIKIENARYLASNLDLSATDVVLDALQKAGYNGPNAKKVMIQSTNSAVLEALKGKKYELVYEVDELIRDAPNATISDIKTFAHSVVVNKKSIYPTNQGFLLSLTDVVPHIQSFNLSVYVQVLTNEFTTIPYDFHSDPIVEINSLVMAAGVDGLITDFPQSAAAYKRSLPLVIARGGFSGLFPDSCSYAYYMAMMTSVSDLVLWCDVQLTKDGVGVCLPSVMINNGTDVDLAYPGRASSYVVDGVKKSGYFSIDFTLKELGSIYLVQGLYSRPPSFDGSMFLIQTVEDVFTQNKPAGFWLNIQHAAFYSQHKLNMRTYVISAAKNVIISHISSPEIVFLQELSKSFASTKTKLVFRFLDQDATEPSTKKTYGALSKNLTFIKSFASGILVPKNYIWPVDATSYLLPHTSLVADAHKSGLEIFASDFANDNILPYNYSYNPVNEYLQFTDNKEFSVDGVLTDFPLTSSEARDCFAHIGGNPSAKAKPLVISHFGASGDYPGCTDIAYTKAISDGAEVIDCPVQFSKDGVPFCLSSVNLIDSTTITQTQFRNLLTTVTEIQSNPGIFSFSLTSTEIQSLTPVIQNLYFAEFSLVRNPKHKNDGKIISLSEFLDLAKNASSLSGVSIKIENARYLASNLDLSATDAVLDALEKAGYNGPNAKKVMIQSTSSAVLEALKGQKYELVYEVDELIRDAPNATISDIKTFADSVVVNKKSIYPTNVGFLLSLTDVVPHIQSFNLSVYVQVLANEFVSVSYDFFSDPIVQMNSLVMAAGVDGLITDFPQSAAAYKRNRCLTMKTTPIYMSAVQPGQLIQLVLPQPPAEAPNPLLNVADISEPPLPVVEKNDSSAPTAAADSPKASPSGQHQITAAPTAAADSPKASPSGKHQITASALMSFLSIVVAVCIMLC